MKTRLLMLAAFIAMASAAAAQTNKTIEKVASAQTLSIQNSFGDVNVHTHAGKNIEVTVEITVSNTGKDPSKLLEMIDVEVKETPGKLELITRNKITNQKGQNQFSIDYTVRMPEPTNLYIKNSFGNTTIAKVSGTLNINQQHGDCYVASASGNANDIHVQFGRLNGASIANGNVEVQHGATTIARLSNITVRQEFGALRITEVKGKMTVDASHGSVKIDNVLPELTSMDVRSQFGSVEIGNVPQQGYRIDFDGDFTTFKYPAYMKAVEVNKDMTSESYKLQCNGAEPEKVIKVRASHGSVKIY